MHVAAGTFGMILLATSYQMLSDMQKVVNGMSILFCDDGHTTYHDYNNYW